MARQRDGSRSGGMTDDDGTEADVPPSDPQEIDFLDRREGRVFHPVEVDAKVREVRERIDDLEMGGGERGWLVGDKLDEFYNGFPERAKGLPTFMALALASFDLEEEEIYEFLRLRRLFSRDQARKYGRAKCNLALQLLKKLGLESLETLLKTDLALPDGETVRFPAPVRVLKAALKLAARPAEGPAPSRKLKAEVQERNEKLKLERAENAAFEGIRAHWVARDGDAVLVPGPLTSDQAVALAKHILKAARG